MGLLPKIAIWMLGVVSYVSAQEPVRPVSSIEDLMAFQKAMTDRLATESKASARVGAKLDRDFAKDLGCPPPGACTPLTKEAVVRYLEERILPAITSSDATKDVTSRLTIRTAEAGASARWMLASLHDKSKSGGYFFLSSSEKAARLTMIRQGIIPTDLGFDPNAAAKSKKPTTVSEDVPIGLYYIWAERDGNITSSPYILYCIVAKSEELILDEWKSSRKR